LASDEKIDWNVSSYSSIQLYKMAESKKALATPEPRKQAPTCPICLEHFTKVIRQPVSCPYCPSKSCRTCTQQYLLSTMNDPHCFGCKREWNREFIDTKLTQTYRKGPLRVHRRVILMDRETGRLPAMQIFVEAQITINKTSRLVGILNAERKKIKAERHVAQVSIEPGTMNVEKLTALLAPYQKRLSENRKLLDENHELYNNAYRILTGKEVAGPRQFIMKCPADACRGFLSSGWKCGTCQDFFCSDCHAKKAGQKDDNHVCNADAKATAAMISKETHPCPKCGIRISKIDGCDQMWCTGCHTTFSWNTGQILLNTITHNPHYYEYLRKTNNGEIPREAGDVPCGGLPIAWQFTRMILELTISIEQKTEILDCLRCLSDLVDVRLPRMPARQEANGNRDLDIAYLLNQMTKDEWGVALERKESVFEKNKEIGLILQTLVHVGSEKMTMLSNTSSKRQRSEMVPGILEEMKKVRDFTNRSLWFKGKQMDMVVPYITVQWQYIWVRKSEMKDSVFMDDKPVVPAVVEATPVEAAAAPAAAVPVATVDLAEDTASVDSNDSAHALIYVELQSGEIVEMPLRDARELFHNRTGVIVGI